MSQTRFDSALLINPPTGLYRRDDRCQCKVEDQTINIIFPPIELASIAAALRRRGVEPVIRDYPAMGRSWEDYLEDLRRLRPAMVLASVTTATADGDCQALVAARETLGRVLTVAKGEYLEALGGEVLGRYPEIDLCLHGEVEEVLDRLHGGEPLEALPGLHWRRPGANGSAPAIVRNEAAALVEDLDALPPPARDLLDNCLYLSPETGNPLTVIHGNRGCPAKCIFCPAGVMSGFRIRYRSPANIVEELRQCVERHGIREFLFHGDTFTINRRWTIELCDRIIESGLRIRWGCNSRVDTIDDERAARMKAAGCWVVAFGVETGDQAILDFMNKGQKVDRAFRAAEICRRNGLRVHAFFVIGMPGETRATLARTYDFARRLDPDFFDFNIAYPLPGTELYEIAVREGLLEGDGAGGGYGSATLRTRELTSRDLERWRRRALLSMYLRPRYVARTLWRAGSPRVTLNYLKAAARRLRQLA